MKYILFTLLFGSVIAQSTTYSVHSDLQVGDTVRVLTPYKAYRLRLYAFVDRSSCIVCMHNLSTLFEKFRDDHVEYVVILNDFTQSEADSFRLTAQWEFPVIGDPYQIYRTYYRIKILPALIALDNAGKVLLVTSPTAQHIGKTIRTVLEQQPLITEESIATELELIAKKRITSTSGTPLKSTFMRRLLRWSDGSRFALINALSCSLMIIDSNGTIVHNIPFRLDTQRCMYGLDLAWLKQDSIILVFGATFQLRRFVATYRFPEDTISNIVYLPSRRYGYNLAIVDDKLVIEYDHPSKIARYLGKDDTLAWIIDRQGRLHGVLLGYDSIYSRCQLSHWCSIAIGQTNNAILTLSQFAHHLRLWNTAGQLLSEYPLGFGKSYRQFSTDIPISQEYVPLLNGKPVHHWISSLAYRHILFDSVTHTILISYRNEEYPDGITDYTDRSVKHKEYLHLCRLNGTPLLPHDLYAGNHFIPHVFNNNEIISTQLDEHGNLEIVTYRLQFSTSR